MTVAAAELAELAEGTAAEVSEEGGARATGAALFPGGVGGAGRAK